MFRLTAEQRTSSGSRPCGRAAGEFGQKARRGRVIGAGGWAGSCFLACLLQALTMPGVRGQT